MASFEELKKRVASGQTSASGNKTGKTSFQDIKKRASEEKFEAEVKKVDSSYIDSFLESANRFYDTAQEDYDKVGWGNASTTYMNRRDTYNNLDYKRRVIQKWMEANQGSFDADSYKSFSDSLAQFGTGASGILDSFSKAREFYSQFDSEDAYNLWKYREDYISAYQADPEKATATFGYDHDLIRAAQYRAEKTKVMGAEDFQDYNRYVSNVKYGLGGKPSFTDDTYAYINNPTVEDKRWGGGEITARELIKANDATYKWDTPLRGSEATEEKNALDHLTKDEIAIYNYYYAKEGKDRADEYLALVQETLNQRKAEVIVGDIQSIDNDILRTIEMGAFGFNAGVDSWASGTKQFFTNEQLPTTAIQYANAEIANSLDGFGQYAYSATNVLGNMAPSILVSSMAGALGVPAKLAQAAGALTMGVSAAGGAYSDALRKGYDKGHARVYSTLVGAAEGGLQYLLGGIGKLGGVSTEKIMSKVAMIDNSLLRISAKLGVDILGEIAEEELQNFLEPALRMIIFGEDYDMPTLDELLETAIVTAITTPILGGVDTITEDISESRYYKDTYGSSQKELVGEALEIDPSSAYAQKLQERLDADKNLNGNQLKRLVEQNETAMTAQDMQAIQKAAANRLTELGETGNVDTIAAALAKQAAGEKLTRAENRAIANSKYGSRVANELNTENIQSGDYASGWAEQIGTNRINAQEYGRILEAAQQPQKAAETTGEQVAANVQNVAQQSQTAPAGAVNAVNDAANANSVLDNAKSSDKTSNKRSEQATVQANDQQMTGKLPTEESSVTPEETVTIEAASKKYGAQAQAMIHTYQAGQDVAKFDRAYQLAYNWGQSGVSPKYVEKLMDENAKLSDSDRTVASVLRYLSKDQVQIAYETGAAVSASTANELDAANRAAGNGHSGRKAGVVRVDGITAKDLYETLNLPQRLAYKVLNTVVEATGINIVFYRSKANADGQFIDENGKEIAQGQYDGDKDPGTLYIDLNAGLRDIHDANKLHRYFMLRTFTHEFMHFLEKWNPIQYNEFRKLVFATMTERGENVHDLIELKQKQNPGMSYEAASREVVAEAMVDILPDSSFVQTLAQKHKGIFNKLLEKLKEFVENLKAYFKSIGGSYDRGAIALKEQVGDTVKYLDSIVQAFDKMAVQGVEIFQATVATEEVVVAKNATTETKVETKPEKVETTVKETAAEVEETAPEVTKDAYGFTISDNAQYGSLEISFDSKPSAEVIHVLKENKFRWHKVKKVWFGYTDRKTISDALHAAYEAESAATENPAMQTLRDMGAKPVGENMLDVTDLMFPQLKQQESEETLAPTTSAIRAEAEEAEQIYGRDAAPTLRLMDREYVVQRKSNGTYSVSVVSNKREGAFAGTDAAKDGFTSFADASEYAIRWILANDPDFKTKWKKTYAELTAEQSDFEKAFWNATQEERDEVVDAINQNTKITHIAPTEIRESASAEISEEVTNNVESETGPDARTVHEPVRRSEGPARLLEGVEPGAVHGSDEGRQPVQSGSDQGTGDAGRDRRADPEGSELPRSTGDRVGGDLQQLPDSGTGTDRPGAGLSGTVQEKRNDHDRGRTGSLDGELRVNEDATDNNVGSKEGTMNTHVAAKEYAAAKGYRIEINKQAARKQMVQVDIYDKQNLPTFSPVIINEASDWNKVKVAIDKREAADKAKDEKLHEEVQQEIEKKSTENPKGSNFVIGDSLNLPNGTKARVRANIDAIRLVKQIEAEGRIATAAEQEILSKYVGWGGLADAFGKPVSNRETRKLEYEAVKGLEAEFEELKGVLTEEEYKSARESTKNAHYTSIEVIKAMYDGLKHLGFAGGRMLEPSSGVGNFVGAMPADMSAQVKSWTMVELDNITGLFAKYLYPNADVRIQGFEETNIPDGYMDVAIGNVPFGNYAITDKHYPKAVTSAIHNYFFAKALDKVRTGGIVMFITSSYTMNGRDNAIRKYMMQRADLLGAIRLPNTAFAGNAGTSVVTDILILKKRADRTEYAGEAFEASNWERVSNTGWDGAYVNEYFIQHPEMVLGTPKLARGLYSSNELTYDPFTDRGTLGEQIQEAFKNIQGKMDYSAALSAEKENFRQASTKNKRQKLIVKDGVVHSKDENGNVTKVEADKDTADRIAGMVAIRDAHTALCDALQQGVTKQEATKLRKALNKAYDSFVEKYGYLNAPKNKKAINAFTDRYSIQSLENYSTEGKKITATKADIFTKDTVAANRTQASAENVEEGLTISLNTVGSVDVAMIARLTGQKAESVTRQMIDQRLVFKDKNGKLIPAAQYLSGNVRAKLREMEGLTGIDSDYKHNVEALREVVPATVQHTDIYVNPGANWVPASVYEDFVGYILKRSNHTAWRTNKKDFSVEYVSETNEYKVIINDAYAKASAQNTQVWGEGGKAFSTIFENMLNGRRTNVYKDAGDGTRVLDKVKTEAVAEKVEKLNEEFRKWLWEDEARRNEMQELYNETYNALVTPKYSGASLTVNGLNSTYELRPHQKDAVARIINSGGNTLLAHRVGAGKTMEMAAAAMKLKQLGIIKKPMFVVPNNVVAQWGKEFKDYFPAANILMVGDEDMTPAERMTTINRIKNNDYDAVILAYTKFEKIQMTKAWQQKFYEEQIDSIVFAINAEKESQGGKGFTVKQLETKRKQLEAKLKKLTNKAKDEDGAMFEDLGVDSLFVDEAHNFKNLEYSTRMNNVSGLGKADGSQRAFDLYTKVRYLQQLNGGRGVVFATATPVMNSMTEMYIMQKYLQPDTLKQLGIEHFDSWAKMFGEVVNALEIAPSGSGYRLKQTFSKFKNVKALQQLFRSFTDVLTDVPGLKIPKMKGKKVQIVECEQGEFQKNYMAELAKRAENVKNVDPSEDNMLKITSDGRKISYSQRMIDPSLPYEETGKIYKCCENVYAVYQESNKTKGTQMIFCDMATPKGKSSTKTETDVDSDEFGSVDMESAQLYDDMKARLIQLGIPANEIAFIHDAKNDKQKAALSEKMNNGTIRVLIGSTGKMGVGLNAQKKAVAIHHLDAPWRPGDIEQRDGRVFRQKNENEEAYKFVYVTRGSFDSRLWDILERKQKFINQVMNGEDVGNEIEDTGEVTLSAAEVKAVASDNPLIMEQVALEKEISKLQSLQQAYLTNVSRAKENIVADRRSIANLEDRISKVKADIQSRKDTYSSEKVFSIQIGSQTYTDKKDAGLALVAATQAKANEDGYTEIGSFAGFQLRAVKTPEGVKGMVVGSGNYEFKTYPMNPTFGINHLISVVESLEEKLTLWNKRLSEAKSDLQTQNEIAAAPFEQAQKLKEKRARYNEVMDILNPPKEEQSLDSDGGDTVQYQSRKYLELDDIRDDIYYPKNSRDAHAFIREYANKTSGMEDGTTKNVFVTTANHAYFVRATGYLKGDIERVIPILGNEDLINDLRKEFRNVTYTSTETSDQMAEDYEMQRGRDGWDHAAAGHTGVSGRNDAVDVEASGSDTVGSAWESFGYNSWEELIEAVNDGAMVMDDDGNLIINKQYQQRSNTLTDREVLMEAAEKVDTSDWDDGQKYALGIFKERLSKLEALQAERAELGRQYKEQQFGTKVDRAAAEQTRNRMKILDGQIEKANAEVLAIEDKQVLRQVLQKARKVVERQQWAKDEEKLKRYRDRRNNADAIKKYRGRLQKDVNDLTNWVLHPNNKDVVKHIPDVLKTAVIPFLSSIDFTSKQQLRGGDATKADQEFMKRLNGLKAALKPNQSVDGLYGDYSDLPPNFMERLQLLIDSAQAIVNSKTGEFVVNQMTSEELRELSQVVRTLKTYIQQFNRFHANAMFQHVSEAGDNTIGDLGQMRNASDKTGTVSNFVFWQQIRPAYAFERFGKGGEAIYDGLRRGQATLAFNTKKIQAFAEKAYTAKEVRAWEEQIKSIQLGDDIVKMPVSTIMSFYELSKRPQALGHILGGGIRVATFTVKGKKISDTGHTITLGDVQTIIGTLTDRQKEVADTLQKFMQEQGGKWGNYVSVKRFGEELFGEEHYFPINSDGRHLAANADEHPSAASLYALLNMGFTKATTEGANNRVVLYSIFDVFANHMASMAQYNAFALPVVDAIKWFNYQQKSEPDENGKRTVLGSVRDQMDRVYGVPEETRPGSGRQGYAQTFVINILRAFNGTEAQGVPTDSTGLTALRQYNMAQVAFNFRVVVQQPLAITRAALLVDYGSIIKGMKLNPAAIQKNIQEMQRYSGIAAWKSLGFYDVNISRGLTDIIKHNSTVRDKISEVGMWGAEKADLLTWAGIWSACKEEVIKKQRIRPKDEGFYEAVAKLFEDVVYKTQVVDSVLTKNEYLRSKGFFARAIGSFMSEPTTTASMLIDAYDKYHADMQRGMNRTQAWKNNSKRIVRTAYVYSLSAVILAAVQAVADAFRDDDDYQTFLEKWLEAFGGNLVDELMPLNKLPILSDFYEVAKELLSIVGVDTYGNAPASVFMQWYDSLIKGVEILYDKISGEDTSYTWYGGAYKLLQAVSGMTGLPMAAATREIVTAWNNIVGAMAPSLKVKTYDPGEKNNIKYAYQDGYLTDEEATAELLEKGLVDTEDEAYWTIQGWEAGSGYSRYDAIFDAVRNGGDFNAAMRELTSHGYTEKDIRSQVKSKIGQWYKDGEITKQQATDMLTKYSGMDSEDITAAVNKWSSKVVTGIAFEDIKDEYMSGNITAARATEMYVRYGGYTQEKATKTVTEWRAEKETGIVYDDIDDAFKDGEISAAEARNMYITYGGYSADKAAEKVGALAFERDYPELSGRITYTQFKRWEADGKPNGVDVELFTDVAEFRDDGTSGSVKDQDDVAAYINSLPISKAQKDALWCCFWKESTLKKAPWH